MKPQPGLGDSMREYASRFGPPTWSDSTGLSCRLVQHYRSVLGPLTVLFEHGHAVALHLPYPTPAMHLADVRAMVRDFTTADGRAHRVLLDDAGCFVVSFSCSELGFAALARSTTKPVCRADSAR